MRYQYYNFKDGFVRMNACFDRVMEFFEIKRTTKTKTLDDLIKTFMNNGYTPILKDFSEKATEAGEGVIVFVFDDQHGHVAPYRNGTYFDTIDMFHNAKIGSKFTVKMIEV